MQLDGYTVYQLREYSREKVITSLFTDPENPDDFIAGYVRVAGDRQCLVESVSPYGWFDGWYAVRNSCVNEVAYDALYAQRLELLLKMNRAVNCILPEPAPDDDIILHTLTWAQEHSRVVTVWTHTEAFTGFVEQADDLYVTIGVLDFLGKNPMPARLSLRNIELMSVGAEEERMFEQLASADIPFEEPDRE